MADPREVVAGLEAGLNRCLFTPLARQLVARLDELVEPTAVLDAGCGTAVCSRTLVARFEDRIAELIGIDTDVDALAVAAGAVRTSAPQRFVTGKVDDPEVEAGRLFGLVVASQLIQHLEQPEAGVRALVDRLEARRGQLALSFWPPSPEDVPAYRYIYGSTGQLEAVKQSQFGFDVSDVESMVRAAGLSVRTAETVDFLTEPLAGPEELVRLYLEGSHFGHDRPDEWGRVMRSAELQDVREVVVADGDRVRMRVCTNIVIAER